MRQPIPFGKYVLLERISVGGMAEVFKAKAFGVEGFEKILAIKRILPSMAADDDFIEMFIDEAKICSQLNHANICQIFELGRVGPSHFIAMEYVWGKDALQLQNRFRKLSQAMQPEMAAFIAAKLCEGLDYAHKKRDALGHPLGIIHRDVSPQNILISYDGEIKIIDFGIAKAASRSSSTQVGVLKGKFGYMSPEQVRGLPLDQRSDVFSIGTILYELLTSERLFTGESDFEILEKVRNVEVPPASSINHQVPPELDQILARALTRDVEDRFFWAADMREALQSFLSTRESAFSAKQLSAWMREQFATEMKREQQVLEQQRQIGREALLPAAANEAELEPGRAAAVGDDLLSLAEEGPEEATVAEHRSSFLEGEPLPEQKTQSLGPRPPPEPSATEEATLILEGGTYVPNASPPAEPPQSVIVAGSLALPYTSGVRTPVTGSLLDLRPPPPVKTWWKDLGVGLVVALLVMGGVMGARGLLAKGARGTLVVMLRGSAPAVVFLDGARRGEIEPGGALTLRRLPAGVHLVTVRTPDGATFEEQLRLASNDVNVLTAVPRPKTMLPGTGKLLIELDTPGAQVYVDGAELADDAWRSPIPLRAETPHEVRIEKPLHEPAELKVWLRAGETVTRTVTLSPLPAKRPKHTLPN